MTTEHTPWTCRQAYENGEPTGFVIGIGANPIADIQTEANAQFIVRAVNSFDAMKAALQLAEKAISLCREQLMEMSRGVGRQPDPESPVLDHIRAALALAERGEK